MNIDDRMRELIGEALAVQFLLAEICKALLISNQNIQPWIESAFRRTEY